MKGKSAYQGGQLKHCAVLEFHLKAQRIMEPFEKLTRSI